MHDVLAAVRDEVRALVEQIAPHETTMMRDHFAARAALRIEARLSRLPNGTNAADPCQSPQGDQP